MLTENGIKGKIIKNLYRKGKFEHSHTAVTNLSKGFPKHLRGKIKNLVMELIKEEILIIKPTFYGLQVSLNKSKIEKIENYIDIFLEESNNE